MSIDERHCEAKFKGISVSVHKRCNKEKTNVTKNNPRDERRTARAWAD